MNFTACRFISRRRTAWAVLTLVAVFIGLLSAACGMKGPLYLPEEANTPKKNDQVVAPVEPQLKQ